MKNKVFLLASMAILGTTLLKAQLNVGSTSAPNASAILQATSTTKGFLPPSMTNPQRNLIANPAYGLLIYNTDNQQVEVYSNITGTAAWGAAGASIYSANGTLTGARTITQANNPLNFKGGVVNIDSSLSVDASGAFKGVVTATTGAILRFGGQSAASTEGIGSTRIIGANINGLDFYTAGTPKLSVTNSGNAGIGTQSPVARLDVAGNMRLGTTLSAPVTDSILTINGTSGIVNKRTVASLNIGTSNNIYNSDGTLTAARTITQSGNALNFTGGTVNIDQSLSVDAGGSFAGGTVTGSTGSILRFGLKNTSSEGIGSTRATGANINGLDFYTAGTSRASITNAGNVGIATQTPGATLDVNGNMRLATTVSGATTDNILTINSSTGIVNNRTIASINANTPNLYNIDGTLTGQRTISQNNNLLSITGGSIITNGGFTIDNDEKFDGTVTGRTSPMLHFGNLNSLEGIASKRTTGGNVFGLDFFASGLSRLSIANGGNVGIGISDPSQKLQVDGNVQAGSKNVSSVRLVAGTNSSDGSKLTFNNGDGVVIGTIAAFCAQCISYTSGNHYFYGNISHNGTLVSSSDRRLKTNIIPVSNAITKVMQLLPYSYNKKVNITDTDYNMKEMGFIAQDVRKIFPYLVSEANDSAKTLAVNYIAIIPLLTKAIQEQQIVITDLKKANVAITIQLAEMKDLKIAMAAMQTELNKIALVNKVAISNIVSK